MTSAIDVDACMVVAAVNLIFCGANRNSTCDLSKIAPIFDYRFVDTRLAPPPLDPLDLVCMIVDDCRRNVITMHLLSQTLPVLVP